MRTEGGPGTAQPKEGPASPADASALGELPAWMQAQFIADQTRKTRLVTEAVARRSGLLRSGTLLGAFAALLSTLLMKPTGLAPFLLMASAGGVCGLEVVRRDLSRVVGAVVYMVPLVTLSLILSSLDYLDILSGSFENPFGNRFLFVWPVYGVVGQSLAMIAERKRLEYLPF